MIRRNVGRVAALVAGLLATLVAVPAAGSSQVAGAQVPGMQLKTQVSALDSLSPKVATVECPPGTVVIYGGGQIFPEFSQDQRSIVLIDLNGPTSTHYSAVAEEVGNFGISGKWLVLAQVVCGPRPSGYEHVIDFPGPGETEIRQSSSPCSQDRVREVIGSGGASFELNPGQATLQSIGPSRGLRSGFVKARWAVSGASGRWEVFSSTFCMDKGSGSAWAAKSSAVNSEIVKSVAVTCEGPGELVHSAGAVATGANGGDAPPGVAITGVLAHANLRGATVTAVASRFTNENWRLTATAVCR